MLCLINKSTAPLAMQTLLATGFAPELIAVKENIQYPNLTARL